MAEHRIGTSILLAAACFLPGIARAEAPVWQTDALGHRYVDGVRDGMRDRIYEQPQRQAIAWEVRNHLGKIGLPDSRPPVPLSGRDGYGRYWVCDDLGYPYYEVVRGFSIHRVYYQPERRAAAYFARQQLQRVAWREAVAAGVRGAVIRGFNGAAKPADYREAVSGAVVDGLNHASPANSQLFQRLVEQGIEDALVQAFNQVLAQAKDAQEANAAEPPQP